MYKVKGGLLMFHGKARMSVGTIIHLNGKMLIEKNFSPNNNAFLSCTNEVTIGGDVLFEGCLCI